MGKTFCRFAAVLILVVFPHIFGWAEEAAPGFPVITRLGSEDTAFRQYLADVDAARRRLAQMRIAARQRDGQAGNSRDLEILAEALTIYAYTPAAGEDLLSLAARCNIPQASLATLNHIPHPGDMGAAGTLLLPSIPGLYIPEEPTTDLERLLHSGRDETAGIRITISAEKFRFIPGLDEDFSPTERAFFLSPAFRFPLRNYRVTSSFGPRINPVTGNFRVHQGLDLAAPLGTEVYAVREGVVTEQGEDTIYGKYIIIQHGDNWVSLYGHLSEIDTVLLSRVRSGTVIGKVGSTGQSTGPHLHFELRQHGRAQDPGKYLFKEGNR
jgi:murein DD-endopeptidase MepM/ murein hydrolase activator NlpD